VILAIPFYGFEAPGRLWILVLLPMLIAAYIVVVRLRAKHGMRYPNTTVLGAVMPKQSQWLRHVIVSLSLLSMLALGLAWARPLGIDQVARERATVVLVIDISWSMTATDVPPTRLDAAKAAATDFVNALPEGYNVSVVSLSGSPAVRLPPLTDHAAAVRVIQALQPQDSSSIGDALMAALSAVDLAPKGTDGSVAPAMIILLSDGSNTGGQAPLQAGLEAQTKGVPIYTIAFGTDNGYVDLDGKRNPVPPDKALMDKLAQLSGGQSYSADNASQLKGAYGKIHSEVGYVPAKKEVTATAAGLSLIFALAAAAGAVLLGVKFR